MSDFLAEKRREIDARLQELRPLTEEYARLEAAKAALDGARVYGTEPDDGVNAEGVAQWSAANGRRQPDRPRREGSRKQQALEVVKANPGVTIPEIARIIGIQQNYLYRVLPTLVDDGLVEKRDRGWHLVPGG